MGRAAMMPHSFIIILYAFNYPQVLPRGTRAAALAAMPGMTTHRDFAEKSE